MSFRIPFDFPNSIKESESEINLSHLFTAVFISYQNLDKIFPCNDDTCQQLIASELHVLLKNQNAQL